MAHTLRKKLIAEPGLANIDRMKSLLEYNSGMERIADEIRRTVGIIDANSTAFIKQYGEMRTGTNLIRALLLRNFTNHFVMMHILGDKHSLPVDLDKTYRETRDLTDPAWEFVVSATYEKPSETSVRWYYPHLKFIQAIQIPLYSAFLEDRIFYVVSIKHPYSWAQSMLRYRGWASSEMPAGSWDNKRAEEFLRTICLGFNEKYEAWLQLPRNGSKDRLIVVQDEHLEDQWESTLVKCERIMNLTRVDSPLIPIKNTVHPSVWDNMNPRVDANARSNQQSKVPLGRSLRRVVTDTIDWDLLSDLGYVPQASINDSPNNVSPQ